MTASTAINVIPSLPMPNYDPATGAILVKEVTGTTAGLTDTQLRVTPVPVSGPLTDTELRAAPVSVYDAGAGLTSVHTRVNSADASGGVYVSPVPAAGMKLVITDVIISVGSTLNVVLRDENNITLMGPYYILANTTLQLTSRGKGVKTATAGLKIKAVASGAGNCTVETWTYQEA